MKLNSSYLPFLFSPCKDRVGMRMLCSGTRTLKKKQEINPALIGIVIGSKIIFFKAPKYSLNELDSLIIVEVLFMYVIFLLISLHI